jgi:hypothetical protein
MLEQLFVEQSQDSSKGPSSSADKNNKKRKVQDVVPADEMDEDEDMYYSSAAARGKKAKGGIGYAGAAKEDVSKVTVNFRSWLDSPADIWSNGSTGRAASQR